MLFEKIGTQDKLTAAQAVAKYWGEKIESVPHPKYRYGCDVHPHGWVEISQEEFSQSNFFRYTALATAWSRTLLGDARLYFMHDDTGFALIGDYHEKKLSVFKFGCQHKFKQENVGNCLTKYTCEKCGFAKTVDSSD
jgi:hypothetical protein